MDKKNISKGAKKSIIKRPWFWPAFGVLLVLGVIGSLSNSDDDTNRTEPEPGKGIVQTEPSDSSNEPDEPEQPGNGTYTLPCGMEFQFWDSVRNDTTGRWRRAATSDSFAPADYAVEYYNMMFYSDDELHSIWNATLKTTTSISVSNNLLFVDTYEYVKGEEHDAKVMFSGMKLDSRIIDKKTGEPLKFDDDYSGSATDSREEEPIEPVVSPAPAEPEQTPTPAPEAMPEPNPEPEPATVATPEPPQNTNGAGKDRRSNWTNGSYLGSTESDKYHDYECRAAKKILAENEVWFASEEAAQAAGYSRCGICW